MGRDTAEMTCREFVELVTEYLEGALSDARRAELHGHIDACGGCTAYLDQMRQTVGALGDLPQDVDLGTPREAAIAAFREFRSRDTGPAGV